MSRPRNEGPSPIPPKKTSRFHRQELDFQVLLQVYAETIGEYWGFGNCREEIEAFLASEIKKSDHGHAGEVSDSELLTETEIVLDPKPTGQNYKVSTVLKNLELRGKIQSGFFSVFMHLNSSRLVTLEGLQQPMNSSQSHDDDVRNVARALCCFDKVDKVGDGRWWREMWGGVNTFFNSMEGYIAPINWLATLIVRGAVVTDLHAILGNIEVFGEFGILDWEELQVFWPKDRKLEWNPGADIVEPRTGNRDSPVVAFWLPYNIDERVSVEAIYKAFDEEIFIPLEDLFFRFFGLAIDPSLPNEMRPALLLQGFNGRR